MKNDIKELIKKNSLNNVLAYLIAFFSSGGLLLISSLYLIYKNYTSYGVISLVIALICIGIGIFFRLRVSDSDWDQLTFDVEKDFDMNLIYSDNYLAISNKYILLFNSRYVFKNSYLLFYFVDNNSLRLYFKDSFNTIYNYCYKYSDLNLFNNLINIIKTKAVTSDILYNDYYFVISSTALFDFNKVSGRDIFLLNNIKELIRVNQNEFIINSNYGEKNYSGTYRYNDFEMCNRTFDYLCNN